MQVAATKLRERRGLVRGVAGSATLLGCRSVCHVDNSFVTKALFCLGNDAF
jgi:hypothetical protein